MAKYSRRQSVEEKKNIRKAYLYVLFSIVAVVLLFFFGITAIVKLAGFIADMRASSEIIGVEDTTPPAPPTFDSIPEYTNNYNLSVDGRAEEGSTVVIFINYETEEVLVGNDGGFTVSTQLNDGENTLSAISRDSAGNESVKSQEFVITYDDQAPDLNVSSPEDGTEFFGANQRQISITGTTDPDAEVSINGRKVIVGSDGSFNYTTTLAEGENEFEITAKDRAGNETKSSLKVSFST